MSLGNGELEYSHVLRSGFWVPKQKIPQPPFPMNLKTEHERKLSNTVRIRNFHLPCGLGKG